MGQNSMIDRTDRQILAHLSKNARISNKVLAAEIGLAPSSVHERTKRLQEDGLLSGAHATVRLDRLGLPLQAVLFIQMAEHRKNDLDRFLRELLQIPEVRGGRMITGRFDAIVELVARDTAHLHRVVVETFSSRAEVSRIETSIIFDSVTQHDLSETLSLVE